MTICARGALALSGVALAVVTLSGCPRPRRERPADAAATVPAPWRAERVELAEGPPDASTSLVLTEERALDAPPASPAGCTLERPVRSVLVGAGPLSFATAAAGARAALAISTRASSALFVSRGDATIATIAPPFATATTLVAAGADDSLVLAWIAPGAHERQGRATVAVIGANDELRGFQLTDRYAPALGDPTCQRASGGARCALALAWREEFHGADEGRAVFLGFDPSERGSSLALRPSATVDRAAALSAVTAVPPSGTVSVESRPHATLADGGVRALAPSELERATIAGAVHALSAHAPTAERCQPAGWAISLSAERADASSVSLGAVDARPRGARLRATGAQGDAPLALWLDAPQCSEALFVIRAHRQGTTMPIASATEYDAAADRALLSLAWREGERIRWARYRCPR